MEITRRMEFDAGHRVLGHEGKCRHLHGHRYVAEVTVRAEDLDEIGRVVDFGVVKERVGKWIDDWWDHNLLLNAEDPLTDVEDWMQDVNGRQPFVMEGNPTAENMAKYLYYIASDMLENIAGLKVVRVRIYETPNCWADYDE